MMHEIFRRQRDGHPAVAERHGVFDRTFAFPVQPSRADEDGRMGLLGWLGIRDHRREFDKLALIAGLWLGPQFLHGAQIVASDGPALTKVHAHDLGLLRLPACAHPKEHPTARKVV